MYGETVVRKSERKECGRKMESNERKREGKKESKEAKRNVMQRRKVK